ncbi:MAG: Stp1/IreP family PP2C-type Ser/Thr phosphatase [Syntrophomonadales bacterium]|jgi:protein phosphatase
MKAAVLSNIGKVRRQNQDRFLVDQNRGLFVVCDGMGGHKAGEVAAQMAIDIIHGDLDELDNQHPLTFLTTSIKKANQSILLRGRQLEECSDMGTTITAAIVRNMMLYTAHIGDSSLFVIHPEGVEKVTQDHTLAEEMMREGILNDKESSANRYRHILTRALGVEESVEIDCYTNKLNPGDRLFMATDGVTDLIGPSEVWETVNREPDLDQALHRLLQLALERGGHDNVTMILIALP